MGNAAAIAGLGFGNSLAALAHGTDTVPAVDRIVGRGGPEARLARELLGEEEADELFGTR